MILSDGRCLVSGKDWILGATVKEVSHDLERVSYLVLVGSPGKLYAVWTLSRATAIRLGNDWDKAHNGNFSEGPHGFMPAAAAIASFVLDNKLVELDGPTCMVDDGPDIWEMMKQQQNDPPQTVDPVQPDGTFIPYAINPHRERMVNKPCVCEHHLNAHGPIELGGGWRCLVAVCQCPGYRHRCPECSLTSMRSAVHNPECRTGILEATIIDPVNTKLEMTMRLSTELELDGIEEEV